MTISIKTPHPTGGRLQSPRDRGGYCSCGPVITTHVTSGCCVALAASEDCDCDLLSLRPLMLLDSSKQALLMDDMICLEN